jgi:hypothetical protein
MLWLTWYEKVLACVVVGVVVGELVLALLG